VTHATISELDPPCPAAPDESIGPGARTPTSTSSVRRKGPLRAVRRPFDAINPATWDVLAAANPWATPFSRWAVHRAWWDAYGANAHEQTMVAIPASGSDDAEPVAIIPLMHRHEVEPDDAILHTRMRPDPTARLTAVEPTAKAVFFGASYHADYATLLAAPADLPAVAVSLALALAAPPDAQDPDHPAPWDVVDLRRLRCDDPAASALSTAFEAHAGSNGWTVTREREEVCPVVDLPPGLDFDGFLATLAKKERHEVRRKLHRAEAAGEVRMQRSADPLADLPAFIDLHQKRWGAEGLFPETPGGEQSRLFFRRLFELTAPEGFVQLHFVTVAGRRIAAGIWFHDRATLYFYNAGIEPDARELSPGILLSALSFRVALEAGCRRFDYLRGDEPYKYEWGAKDAPIQRLLVVRTRG
jgi:Acetyltransferase (GNAT) domain